jgi:hypothetical protein
VVVPRSRFAPVKTCSDLFALRSDAYKVRRGPGVLAWLLPAVCPAWDLAGLRALYGRLAVLWPSLWSWAQSATSAGYTIQRCMAGWFAALFPERLAGPREQGATEWHESGLTNA